MWRPNGKTPFAANGKTPWPGGARIVLAVAASVIVLVIFRAVWHNAWHAAAGESIGAVIPLSSIEAAFAAFTITEAARVSTVVVVVYADHLSDGTKEDLSYVDAVRAQVESSRPGGTVVWAPVRWFPGRTSRFWVRYLRWVGFGLVPRGTDYLMWLDADEVIDAPRFVEWWASAAAPPSSGEATVKLDTFVYFRDERFQSTVLQNSPVVVRRSSLDSVSLFFDNDGKEREMFFDDLPTKGTAHAAGRDGKPLVHHYSWVRTKEGMLQKVRAWGHNADGGNWEAKVEEEFSHPFKGKDFVHGDAFRTLPSSWLDTLRARLPQASRTLEG